MTSPRALLLTLLVSCGGGSAWAGAAADDLIGIHKKFGSFTAPSATATRCLCVHGDPDDEAGRILLHRDEGTYPVDCEPPTSPDATECRQTGGSVLSIDQ